MTPREVGQKIYTTWKCGLDRYLRHALHEISEHRNLGFIMRAEDPVDKRAGQSVLHA